MAMELSLEQNTDQWKAERAKRIGASCAPIIMGVSPFKTALTLWEEAVGLVERDNSDNYATSKGHNLEPEAINHYELETNIKTRKACFQSSEFPYLMASLDGWNDDLKLVLEIKFMGKEAHAAAKNGEVPKHYWPQLQMQMLVADADICHFYSFDGLDGALVRVNRDSSYINDQLLPSLIEFRRRIIERDPPELSERDYKKCTNQKVLDLVSEYAMLSLKAKETEGQMKLIKQEIFAAVKHSRVLAGSAKIISYWRRGSVDYKKIPQLKGVDLEPFRKAPFKVDTIRFGK